MQVHSEGVHKSTSVMIPAQFSKEHLTWKVTKMKLKVHDIRNLSWSHTLLH